ncbi:MAG: YkgJ family cysteine cluster protein [Pirellulaceae bacterium]|jgi:Fe-S-cluster containining protein
MNSLPITHDFICVRCSRHMKTCCQTSEVYATPGDVKRIQQHSGRSDFTVFQAPDDPVYLQQDDDPEWLNNVFRADGTRRVLKRHDNGDCTFLGEAGCVLPLEVRPLICRIYPYDYTAAGLREELARGCPLELLPEGQELLEALDISRDDAVRWHALLYEEIKQEPHEDAN